VVESCSRQSGPVRSLGLGPRFPMVAMRRAV
jgi:hypothetical protein